MTRKRVRQKWEKGIWKRKSDVTSNYCKRLHRKNGKGEERGDMTLKG